MYDSSNGRQVAVYSGHKDTIKSVIHLVERNQAGFEMSQKLIIDGPDIVYSQKRKSISPKMVGYSHK